MPEVVTLCFHTRDAARRTRGGEHSVRRPRLHRRSATPPARPPRRRRLPPSSPPLAVPSGSGGDARCVRPAPPGGSRCLQCARRGQQRQQRHSGQRQLVSLPCAVLAASTSGRDDPHVPGPFRPPLLPPLRDLSHGDQSGRSTSPAHFATPAAPARERQGRVAEAEQPLGRQPPLRIPTPSAPRRSPPYSPRPALRSAGSGSAPHSVRAALAASASRTARSRASSRYAALLCAFIAPAGRTAATAAAPPV